MRCKACDTSIDKPVWNRQLQDWELCGVCLEIVFDTVGGFDDAHEEEVPTDEDIFNAEDGLEIILETE